MNALENANRIRLAGADIRRRVKAGEATFRYLIENPDAAHLTVDLALRALPGVGHKTARAMVRRARILIGALPNTEKRVRDLSDGQREDLMRVAEEVAA